MNSMKSLLTGIVLSVLVTVPSAKANDTTYGLHGAVYTQDPERGFAVAREYRAGSVAVNHMAVDIHMPFGGFKQSGIGRDGGIEGLENYTETKAVYFG